MLPHEQAQQAAAERMTQGCDMRRRHTRQSNCAKADLLSMDHIEGGKVVQAQGHLMNDPRSCDWWYLHI